ncbi:NlpC/P60 family protein [Spirochaeta africana]|uniref:Cell wall-associated hydrolase, invasion-associated protein n=1 Tax=Spirochaeta africana (strain ATCC 700263 / DSM 8902 / Z-7692) TaxID=889378 RepID=H9UH29_SPIAZ|nr:NlpC/P60 family protein [Spirochaeta africana]AFG36822.1 cell wall-associated hydrolase, invasion-associated protein [Spirochaeta africana DSM 8902]
MRYNLPTTLLMTTLLVFSCVSVDNSMAGYREVLARPAREQALREQLVAAALRLEGARELVVAGRAQAIDCTVIIKAVYREAGIDLSAGLSRYQGSRVERLHAYLGDQRLLHTGSEGVDLQPGDLIFWDNTYDRNGSGRPDDELTHVGMVIDVAENGDVRYIHHNYARGVVVEHMNLAKPSVHRRPDAAGGGIANSFLRSRQAPPYERRLAGELFNSAGQAPRLGL